MVKRIDYTDKEQKYIQDSFKNANAWFAWINKSLMPYINALEKRVATCERVNREQSDRDKEHDDLLSSHKTLLDGLAALGQKAEEAKEEVAET